MKTLHLPFIYSYYLLVIVLIIRPLQYHKTLSSFEMTYMNGQSCGKCWQMCCAVLQYTCSLTPIQYVYTISVCHYCDAMSLKHRYQINCSFTETSVYHAALSLAKCSLRLATLLNWGNLFFLLHLWLCCIKTWCVHFNLHDFHHAWRWTDHK